MAKKRAIANGVQFLVGIFFFCVLGACDPLYTLHVTRSDYSHVDCKDDAQLSYTAVIAWKDGRHDVERFATSRTSSALATKPDHPLIKYIPGMEQDFLWVQFSLYCGISKKPVLVTPKITTKDFVKKDERNYYYFVD